MYRAIYISHAKSTLSDHELDSILSQARRSNHAIGVTGMLLYCKDTFFQVLEGPRAPVYDILDRVYRDPRHFRMKVLSHGTANKRRFRDWSMGFRRVGAQDPDHQSFFNLSRQALDDRIPKNAADDLLKLMGGFATAKLPQ